MADVRTQPAFKLVDPTTNANEAAVTNAEPVGTSMGLVVRNLDASAIVDDAAFTPATDVVLMVGAEFDDASPDSVNEGDAGAVRMSANRNLYVNVRDNAGNERGLNVDANGEVGVGAVRTSVTPGTAAANLGKAEDAAHASADVGVFVLGVRNDVQTTFTSADADYSPIAVDLKGNPSVVGNIAHDGVDAGAPLLNGYRAIAHGTNPTAVAAADRTVGFANRAGVPFVIGGHPNVVVYTQNFTAAQTDTALVTVAGGLKIVVTRVTATAHNANTVNVAVRIGFGATVVPAYGNAGIVASHPGVPAGGGFTVGDGSGILGVGADGEDLRLTSGVPTSGSLDVSVSYFTIES